MKTLEEQIAIAKKARALIEDPNNWTQGAYATDKDGVALDQPLDDEAVCFCMIGAIRRAEGNPHETLAFLDKAIASLEASLEALKARQERT